MANLIVGTAGHIDHGKSSLVHALTGIDPDRLQEEKRRGITIELGFADLDLGAGAGVSFVDVPGHERFVRQMVAGATGIDAVLLVVAADEGVRPQTREHLAICRLLGVDRGVVALTKCDLVEPELRQVVALEVRDLVAGSRLAHAPIVEVSVRSGEGTDALKSALAELVRGGSTRPAGGLARLPVDRSFVMRGFGTVVTGTLASGTLSVGDEVEVLPCGAHGRVRGLQIHRHKVASAEAGSRVAVNLQGLECADVPRGSTLTRRGEWTASRRLWARVTLLAGAPTALAERGGPVRLHLGTADVAARLRVLGREGGTTLHAELRLAAPLVAALGDRFILRRPAPVDTIGGGVIVDAAPPGPRQACAACFEPSALDPGRALALRLGRAGAAGAEPHALARQLGCALGSLERAAAPARWSRPPRAGSMGRPGARPAPPCSPRSSASTPASRSCAACRARRCAHGWHRRCRKRPGARCSRSSPAAAPCGSRARRSRSRATASCSTTTTWSSPSGSRGASARRVSIRLRSTTWWRPRSDRARRRSSSGSWLNAGS
jgi:selenocysteine-specific elongation factor